MAPIATLTVKLGAQIAEFQSEFREASRSAQKFQSDFQGIATKASAFGNIIASGVMSAVGQLGTFARTILENAGHITDLAKKTGLTTESIQRMQAVAEQTGTTIDAFTTSAFKLGANLSTGSKSVVAAVGALGLSFKDLQRLSPDEQFNRIATALGKMENPQERNQLALTLFGKTAKDILPAISEGYADLARDVAVSSDGQIKALDAAGDAWARFTRDATTHATAFAGTVIQSGQALAKAGFSGTLAAIRDNAGSLNFALADLIDKMNAVSNKGKDVNLPLPAGFKAPMTDYLKALAAAREELKGLSSLEREQIAAAQKLGVEHGKLADEFGISETALRLLTEVKRAHVKVMKDAAIVVTSEMVQVQDLLAKAHDHQRARLEMETQAWNAWEDTVSTALQNVTKNSAPLLLIGRELSGIVPMIDAGGAGNLAGVGLAKGPGLLEKMFGTKADVQNYFKSTFGDLSAMLSNAITGAGSIAGALKAYATNVAKDFAATALSFIPGIGPLLSQFASPIIDGLKKAFSSIFGMGTAGRDVVKDFAGSMGGFDALHVKLNELGAEGEQLWIRLTQGVGRNNPDQARAAIEAIVAALERQKQKTAEVAVATTSSAAAQQTALDGIAQKYGAIIDGLKGELGSFSASLKAEQDAPEFDEIGNRIYGVLESQQMKRQEILVQQIKDAETAAEAETAAQKTKFDEMLIAGTDVDERLREMFGQPLDIPYRFVAQNSPSGLTGGSGSPAIPPSAQGSARASSPNLDVTLKLPNNQVLLRQFVSGMESEGLA